MQSPAVDEVRRRAFEAAWAEGRPQPIEQFLPPESEANYLSTLEELVHIELEFAWQRRGEGRRAGLLPENDVGAPARVEDYLRRFPALNRPDIVSRLLEQEYEARRRCGGEETCDASRHAPPTAMPCDGLEPRPAAATRLLPGATRPPTAPGEKTQDPLHRVTAGRRFGNYELLEELGHGGMGVVYRAWQVAANRTVALKLIRPDFLEANPADTRSEAMDRFQHEIQAAAALEHESIVGVYEVGDAHGVPFYSMRYVDGESLDAVLGRGPLENRQAARYLESVARAVEEAHRHKILHRDIKPSNILIDARADRPMVVDFGLAKLVQAGDELTHSGQIMGSPPYMSPEQARDSSRVTVQSDVYGLGATLYHMLTGRPPFQAASMLETLQQVIEAEPVPPRRLNPAIDRDLETICLRCLQKEPARRYPSAQALGDDLSRYLSGEPIAARPVSWLERVVRWSRRKPLLAAMVASTAASIALALAAAAVGYVKTASALRQSEASFRQARDVVDQFFTRVSEDTLLNQPGMQPLRRDLLKQALDYYERFLTQRGDDPAMLDEVALTHFRIGRISKEIDAPDRALASYRRALEIQRGLAADRPHDSRRLQSLANTLSALGTCLAGQRRLEEALEAHSEAAAVRARLAGQWPDDPEFQRTLASSYMNIGVLKRESGRLDEARQSLDRAQAIRRQLIGRTGETPELRRDLGMGCYNLAVVAAALRDHPAALENFQQAAGLFESLLQENPKDFDNRYRLVLCYRMLADQKSLDRGPAAAQSLYREAVDRLSNLARSNPDVPEYQAALASLLMNLGGLQHAQGDTAGARTSLERAHTLLEPLARIFSDVPVYRRDLALVLRELGCLAAGRRDFQAAQTELNAAETMLRELARQFPGHVDYEKELAKTVSVRQTLQSPVKQQRPGSAIPSPAAPR